MGVKLGIFMVSPQKCIKSASKYIFLVGIEILHRITLYASNFFLSPGQVLAKRFPFWVQNGGQIRTFRNFCNRNA